MRRSALATRRLTKTATPGSACRPVAFPACQPAQTHRLPEFRALRDYRHTLRTPKFHAGDDTVGPKIAREILEKHPAPAEAIDHVCDIIAWMSFKGAG